MDTAKRTGDAAVVNGIMASAFGAASDFSTKVADPANIVLVGDHGCAIFAFTKPGIYSLTLGIRPAGRGAWAKTFVQDALRIMFEEHGAEKLWAMALADNPHVMALAALTPGIIIEHCKGFSTASINKEDWYAHAA